MTPVVVVVIPALDEAGSIEAVVMAVLEQPSSPLVVVADNGSTDATAELASRGGAVVVGEARRGYGYACAAGVAEALRRDADIVVFLDGDHSSDPTELGRVLAPIIDGQADLVLGSRVLGSIEKGAMAPHQRFGNRWSALLMRRLYGLTVTDLGPFRAIDARLLAGLGMTEMTFGWPTEMTVKTARRGGRIVEVPVAWNNRRAGRSKVSGTIKGSVLAGYHILRVTLRHRARSEFA